MYPLPHAVVLADASAPQSSASFEHEGCRVMNPVSFEHSCWAAPGWSLPARGGAEACFRNTRIHGDTERGGQQTCAAAALLQGCLPDKLFAAFKPIPREDFGGGEGEAEEDPFEPSELPSACGGTQDAGDGAAAAMGE